MPTGYTAGILDGTTKDFQAFAKKCMRSFGATIHMREDPLDKEYEKVEPSTYHLERIEECKKELEELSNKSDVRLISEKRYSLIQYKCEYEESIKNKNKNRKKLEDMLEKANWYQPPTLEHINVKEFMIEQLQTTIEHDCSDESYYRGIKEFEEELEALDAKEIRKELVDDINKNIKYHKKRYKEEVKSCKEKNKWVEDFLESIKGL